MKRVLKYIVVALIAIPLILWLSAELMLVQLELNPPSVEESEWTSTEIELHDGVRFLGNNWYRQNDEGLWEAYIEGAAYNRGKAFGLLAEEEVVSQEKAFVSQVKKLVPSDWFLKTLKYGVVFFNRNLPDHISEELQKEIYGVSRSFADEFDFIGQKYSRILNYHAAHDIGHALQDLSIVGCTSFAVWNQHTQDSSLVIGRNFDFYMGDDFAKNKIVLFVKPDSGHAFASITWAGFMGVVSGMNEHGLTVTLNAAKSEVPNGAKTPISILAREILQYATTIDEAYAIAKSRQTFVSESILIGSAKDHAAAIIEKSPNRIDIYRPGESRLTCANHYQSETFKNDEVNLKNIESSDSEYRFKRMNQLLDTSFPLNASKSVDILRNKKGIDDAELGMGNPKALNQLLAHHGIVFQPEKKLLWVSTNPFQLGEFICYDLNTVFGNSTSLLKGTSADSLNVPADAFLNSESYSDFLRYKELKNRLFDNIALGQTIEWNEELEAEFIDANPESYVTYFMLGDYYLEQEMFDKARSYYNLCLSKEVASLQERRKVEENLKLCH